MNSQMELKELKTSVHFVCSQLCGLSFKHTSEKLLTSHSVQANYISDSYLYFFKQLLSQSDKSIRAKRKVM